MFLVAICLMARSSCITTYCPRIEELELPPPSMWDADGYPQFIELGLMCAHRMCPPSLSG